MVLQNLVLVASRYCLNLKTADMVHNPLSLDILVLFSVAGKQHHFFFECGDLLSCPATDKLDTVI